MSYTNEVRSFGGVFDRYYMLHYNEQTGKFLYPEEKVQIVEEELALCGYFVIVTSEKMTAKEATDLYKSRDASEKLFRGDKPYRGNSSIRVYSDESAASKIFIEFIALIIRCRGDLPDGAFSDKIINRQKIGDYFIKIKEQYGMNSPRDIQLYAKDMFANL